MISGGIVKRYVKPLFEIAEETGELDKTAGDLQVIDQALRESTDLQNLLFDPSISKELKKSIIEKIFPDASPNVLNFIRVIINKNRLLILKSAFGFYSQLLNEFKGITLGTVETAIPIDNKTFEDLKKDLEKRLDKKLSLERKVEPALLGGIRVRIGNSVIDGSVRARLNGLKKALSGN